MHGGSGGTIPPIRMPFTQCAQKGISFRPQLTEVPHLQDLPELKLPPAGGALSGGPGRGVVPRGHGWPLEGLLR